MPQTHPFTRLPDSIVDFMPVSARPEYERQLREHEQREHEKREHEKREHEQHAYRQSNIRFRDAPLRFQDQHAHEHQPQHRSSFDNQPGFYARCSDVSAVTGQTYEQYGPEQRQREHRFGVPLTESPPLQHIL